MSEDRTLFGDGRYPDTGPLAVAARIAFGVSSIAIVVAAFVPGRTPSLLYSHYLEHFAAFYLATLLGLAAMPRIQVRRIGMGYLLFATAVESSHLLFGASLGALIPNWVADLGGAAAAIVPVVAERFRQRFPPRPT